MARAPFPLWAVVASVGLHAAALVKLGPASSTLPEGTEASLWMGEDGAPGMGAQASIPIEIAADDVPPGAMDDSRAQEETPPQTADPGAATPAPDGTTPDRTPKPRTPRSRARSEKAGENGGERRASTHVTSAGATAGASGPGGTGEGTGEPGAAGAVVHGVTLPLLRVLPLALSADPSWSTVAVGAKAVVELDLVVDDAGRARLERPASTTGAGLAQVPALVDQMLKLLAWPRFAVRAAEMGPGVDKARLVITVAQDTASAEVLAASGGAYGLGADAPEGRRPGRAHCTWANGRRVNVTVQRLDP